MVSRTPFFYVYQVIDGRVEVLRIPDSRSFDSMLLD